ncbi:hypothetical protein [Fischerella sp. PCC 9605]|nr:hypothetical protein [Fischerella sp. PCC 9605]
MVKTTPDPQKTRSRSACTACCATSCIVSVVEVVSVDDASLYSG